MVAQHGAGFLAQTAVGAERTVNLGIPKAFLVSLETDGPMTAYIAAGIASATLALVVNLYHASKDYVVFFRWPFWEWHLSTRTGQGVCSPLIPNLDERR